MMGLVFRDITVHEPGSKDKVLEDVSGTVMTGEILAVLGLEVSGKTTLLSTLAGRVPLFQGTVSFNKAPLEYTEMPRKVAFVQSQTMFLPTLTVKETLENSAYLRLPPDIPTSEKVKAIDMVENIAELHDVADTPVMFASTLTKKCLNIACELMTGAAVVAIDDPLLGLSYKDCHNLMEILVTIATQMGKALVVSFESPNSHVINMCQRIICLHQRQMVYSGRPTELRNFLVAAGCPCTGYQSPIEQLMLVLGDFDGYEGKQQTLIQLARRTRHSQAGSQDKLSSPGDPGKPTSEMIIRETVLNGDCDQVTMETDLHGNSTEITVDIPGNGDSEVSTGEFLLPTSKSVKSNHPFPDFSTSFWYQVRVLTARTFHSARRRILFPVGVIQNFYILVLCVLIWWRPPRTEDTVKDRMGLFFFTTVQWAFFALLDAILTFPKEKRVILRELDLRLYRTSAFCVSKMLTEVPLALIQPCVYMCVIYWVANLNSFTAFLGSLGVLAADVIAAQSIGLFVGAALNPPWTVSIVSLGLLSMMLWAWLSWGKFASYFTYGLNAFITLEFGDAEPIKCAESSMVPICNMPHPVTNQTITEFPANIILLAQGQTWSTMDNIYVLLGILVVMRVLFYIVLRIQQTRH